MSFNTSQKEIERLSALKPFDRYKYTIKKVIDFELIYTLLHDDGAWALAEVEGKTLVSLWPASSYAQLNATDAWRDYKSAEIGLGKLLDSHLTSL